MDYLHPEHIREFQHDLLHLLRELVELESPTTDKAAVDALGERIAEEMYKSGAEVERHPRDAVGDHWSAKWGTDGPMITLLTHMDTVHPLGTLGTLPWQEKEGRIYGPGILDMKSSIAMALTAVQALQRTERLPAKQICLLCTSDEETGSNHSQELIQSLARQSELVLCLEPALPDGSLKTWRKGVGVYRITALGKPSHAGANPNDGVNAILEMAAQIQAIHALHDDSAGTTLNVGLIRGGTRTNVVPARCSAVVDIRVENEAERIRVSQALESLQPTLPGSELQMAGEWNRPPMPRTEVLIQTFEKAQALAARIGLEISEGGTGGGSDANFVAPLGIPLLDGLGAIGGGAHTLDEYVEEKSLIERTALLATLLMDG